MWIYYFHSYDFHIFTIFLKCFLTFLSHFVVTPTRSKVDSYSHISFFCLSLHRRLCHPHIVTFYSAVFRKVPRGLKVAFVTECPGVDLKKYLIDQPGNCPAKNSVFSENAIRRADQNSFWYLWSASLNLANTNFNKTSGTFDLIREMLINCAFLNFYL